MRVFEAIAWEGLKTTGFIVVALFLLGVAFGGVFIWFLVK